MSSNGEIIITNNNTTQIVVVIKTKTNKQNKETKIIGNCKIILCFESKKKFNCLIALDF